MGDHIFYKMRSGKPIKFLDFLKNFAGLLIPDAYYRSRLKQKLAKARKRPDYAYMQQRVDYYMRITSPWKMAEEDKLTRDRSWIHYTGAIGAYRRKMFHTAYYFDQHDVTRWFPPRLRWNFCPGDVYFTPEVPTVVKSRLLASDNQNSVVLKLDKLRHFMYVHDTKPFREKKDCAIFRGKIRQSRLRTLFLEKFFGNPLCDCGVVGRNEGCPEEWMAPEVKDDFSDFEEKLHYYIHHPEEAEEIIRHAHEYVSQFRNEEREELLQLMVMERYFKTSGQI